MRASLGQAEAEAVSGNNASQFNAFIDTASLETHGDGPWPVNEIRATLDLGIAQYKVAYPTDCGVGCIREVAMCLADNGVSQYVPLIQAPLPAYLDPDQQEAAGGSTFEAIQGEPLYWNQRGGYIYTFPVNNDQARKLRVAYQPRKIFANDDQVSSVDGEAILYKALQLYFESIEDTYNADKWEKRYAKRIGTLKAWQSANHALDLDSDASFDPFRDPNRSIPNWDERPTTR